MILEEAPGDVADIYAAAGGRQVPNVPMACEVLDEGTTAARGSRCRDIRRRYAVRMRHIVIPPRRIDGCGTLGWRT